MELSKIYTQIITQNNRATHNRHHVEGATHKLEGVNPTCGDEITLELRVENDIIKDAGFTGTGCAISQASSSIMIDIIIGKTVEEAMKIVEAFFRMIRGEEVTEEDEDMLEDALALQGVSVMPARVKCATLAWHTLEDELKEE